MFVLHPFLGKTSKVCCLGREKLIWKSEPSSRRVCSGSEHCTPTAFILYANSFFRITSMSVTPFAKVFFAACCLFSASDALAKNSALSNEKVKENVIAESIASYPSVCACPFNRTRNGSACGRRSAWSKAGGYAPICYINEVTDEMVRQWRENNS